MADAERIVFAGDSLAVEGAPNYPTLLSAEPGGVAAGSALGLAVDNLAVAGSTSADWLPRGALFRDQLSPLLAGADAVFVTVGGNDLEAAFNADSGPGALEAERSQSQLARVSAAFAAIETNLGRTFRAIRRIEPGIAIAFLGYPDYSRASAWVDRTDTFGLIALRTGLERIEAAAEAAGADLVISMLEPSAARGVDPLLSDAEHLSPAGHRFYARQLVRRLGPGR